MELELINQYLNFLLNNERHSLFKLYLFNIYLILLNKINVVMIYVFKTSLRYKKQIKEIAPKINSIEAIKKWNFDLEDCDKIFRIEANKRIKKEVIKLFNQQSYHCEELV